MLLASAALGLGLLHGLGADHLMAIAALSIGSGTTAGPTRSRAFQVALSFAFGHALLLATGTLFVVVAGWTIPVFIEQSGEILGGCILILLGLSGLWLAINPQLYGHSHPHLSSFPTVLTGDWHLHIGQRHADHHHSRLSSVLGGVFAISGLRTITLLAPFGFAHDGGGSLATLLILVLVFSFGILLSMSLFGIVLASAMSASHITLWTAKAAALITALGAFAMGIFWVFW